MSFIASFTYLNRDSYNTVQFVNFTCVSCLFAEVSFQNRICGICDRLQYWLISTQQVLFWVHTHFFQHIENTGQSNVHLTCITLTCRGFLNLQHQVNLWYYFQMCDNFDVGYTYTYTHTQT